MSDIYDGHAEILAMLELGAEKLRIMATKTPGAAVFHGPMMDATDRVIEGLWETLEASGHDVREIRRRVRRRQKREVGASQ